MLTFVTAAVVLWQQTRQQWIEDYLPNRLTVHFYYKEREVMRCQKAYLSHESDIRALSQQIGAQMVGEQLKFRAPAVYISPPVVERKEKYVHYTAKFVLTDLPQQLRSLECDEILLWDHPFNEEAKRVKTNSVSPCPPPP